jgi:hypothetical protein
VQSSGPKWFGVVNHSPGAPRVELGKSDDDGFTAAEGDCDDFAPLTNPGVYDLPVARAPGQTGYTKDCSDEFPADSTDFPKGFDGASSTCDVEDAATSVVDAIALELKLRVPTNVTALSFDSGFFTDE